MKHRFIKAILFSSLLSLTIPALAEVSWTSAPVLMAERIKGGDRRSQSGFRPVNISTEKVLDYPSSKSKSIPKSLKNTGNGVFTMQTGGRNEGNYHWVTAEGSNGLQYASTVHYFSNPGPAPRKMLKQSKVKLDIRPLDLPREHQQFRSNESWKFIVFSDGVPLKNKAINFDTSNGSQLKFETDSKGIFNLMFPADFKDDPHRHHREGHASHRPASAKFVVSVSHNEITSAFNYKYSEDAYTNKTVLPAVGILFAGSLVTGIALFRRRSA